MSAKYFAKEIYLEDRIIYNGSVEVENERIVGVAEEPAGAEPCFEKIFPGFIDMHMHGGDGHDVMEPTYEAIDAVSRYKLREGVTSFVPAPITAPMDEIRAAVSNLAAATEKGVGGAKILGIFLEGPYICVKYKGAHEERYIRSVSQTEIDGLIALGRGRVKSVAVAPELPGALDVIKHLVAQGVKVSLGHSAGTYDEIIAGIDAGGSIAIHTYNAMSPLTHRAPGMVGAVLTDDRIYGEMICDLIHLHPAAMKVICRAKGAKVVLVTDCMSAGGLPEGSYALGGQSVVVKDGAARLPDGVLAGSVLDMLTAVKNAVASVGVSLFDAVKMATINPAKAVGENDIGSIAPGKIADIVCMGEDMKIRQVLTNGSVRWRPV